MNGRIAQPEPGEVTRLLGDWRHGELGAESRLFELVLPELRRLAGYVMRRERREHTLQATALVAEAYFKLVAAKDRDWQNRQHFFAIAARAMRRFLIDYARRCKVRVVPLEEFSKVLHANNSNFELAVVIDSLLQDLLKENPAWCSIVELKFFLGLTDEEAADALGIPLRTFQREFGDARRWLFERMESVKCTAAANTTNS